MTRKVLSFASLVCVGIGIAFIIASLVTLRGGGETPWKGPWLAYISYVLLIVGLILTYILWFPRCWVVTAKELRSYFTSPIAYAVMMAVFGISGLLFWWTLKHLMTNQGEGVGATLMTTCFLLLLISPLLTMRLFAEEKRSGTYEILMTHPVHDLQVVVGKFAAAMGVMLVMLGVTFVQPLFAELGGDPDWGPVWSAYVGLLGWSMAFVAIGVFTSALTSSQIAAAALSWFILIIMWLLGALRSIEPGKAISKVGEYLSVSGVMDEFSRGTIDTTRLVYLASVTVFFLFAAWMTLFAVRSR
ncbi:MAG: ABC transporter permease [Candidatus Zipacnadales bacterium]